ncbi:MAG: hypothetical protein ABSG51_06685, partial [Terracidiphilus sp.]
MNTASATPVTTTTTLKLGLTTSAGTPITISEPYGTSVTLTAIVTGTGGAVGTVDFTDSNGANPSSIGCDSVNVAYGIASCTTSTLPVGANILNAAFTPTDNTAFAASDTTAAIPPMTYTVLTTSTTTAVGIGLATAPTQLLTNGSEPYGTNMTLTAKITCNSATCTTAAGTMTFTYGASPSTAICTNVQVVSGSAQCTTATLPVSTNETLNAIFTPGSAAFVSSNTLASPLAFAVTAAPTTTALGFFPVSPQTFGTSVTLTATVSCGTPSATCTTAAGTVSFSYGTSPAIPIAACSGVNAVQLSSGIAPCTTATLPLGVNTVNAAFTSTSSSFGSSTASPQSFHVTANAPAVTIGTSSAAPVFGTAVTLTAGGLPAGAGAPVLTVGGTADAVTFLYGTKSPYITPVVCTNVVTIGAGGASCTTYMLPVQANSVVAVFTPGTATASDYTFPVTIPATTSFTSATPVTVTPTAATQSVTLTALPSNYTYVGAVVTLTATLGVPAAADQGTVAFTFGAPVVTGTTTKIYTNPTTATTSLSCATQPITTNANGVTTATCTAPAALTAVTTSTSYNLLQAVYTPKTTGNFVAKAGLTGTADLAVLGAAVTTTTAVTAMPGPNYYGATTLTATVSCATACPTVAGSVSFYNNNVLIAGTETALASGVTTMTPTVPLPVGTNSITATYNSADTATSWGNSSTTSITPVIVIATPTKAVLYAFSSATAASVYGGSTAAVSATQLTATMASTSLANHAFSLYATIASSAGTAVINSGHVSFYDVSTAGSTLLGTASVNVVNGVGTALFTINCQAQTTTCYGSLGVGNHYFAANYGGVYNGTGTAQFAGTMSDTAPVLVSGAPTLTITASSPSVVYGSAVPV